MKKINKYLFLSLFAATMFITTPAKSQGLCLNAGVSYGADLEEFGARAGVSLFLSSKMRIGGDLTYWFLPKVPMVSVTALELNGHFHLFLLNQDGFGLYAIAALGLHYAKASAMGISETDTRLAPGVGGGLEYNFGSVSIFAEPKYFFDGNEQFKVSAGVRIKLGN